jgi:methylmalonyl-CoA/ethylmalonyl-CoA epimerase
MRLDHVCVAVRSLDRARAHLCALLGYNARTAVVTNTRQKVRVVFLSRPGSLDIKLIEPSEVDSPLWGFLQKKGEGLHHVCFRTGDLGDDLPALVSRGLRLLGRPEPGEAFDDHLIAFGYAGFGLNVEFIDSDARRAELESGGAHGAGPLEPPRR